MVTVRQTIIITKEAKLLQCPAPVVFLEQIWVIVKLQENVMIGAKPIPENVQGLIPMVRVPEIIPVLPAEKLKKQIVGPGEGLASAGITGPVVVNVQVLFPSVNRLVKVVKPENGGINKTVAVKLTVLIHLTAPILQEAVAVVIIGTREPVSAV